MQEQTQEIKQEDLFKIDTSLFLGVVKSVREIITKGRIKINKDGLSFVEIDLSNVAMVGVKIKPSQFIELTDSDRNININFDWLYNALKDNKKTYVIATANDTKLYLSFDNGIKTEINLIEIEEDKKEFPNFEFKAEIEINSKRLKEVIKNLSNISDSVCFEVKNNTFKMVASGINKSEIVFNSDDIFIKSKEEIKSRYSLEYLNKFVKTLLTDKIILKFDNTYPLQLEQKTGGFEVVYILAPRVEEE